jgi:hypothetical protein
VSGSIRFADQSVDNDTTGQPIQAGVAHNTYFDLPDDPTLRRALQVSAARRGYAAR